VGFIIVFIFVVIISCSLVSLHEKRKGLLPTGVLGEIVIVSNEGGGKGIDCGLLAGRYEFMVLV
jgi:hypothetical protein